MSKYKYGDDELEMPLKKPMKERELEK